MPPNAGSFRRIHVHLRENCVRRHPAASGELLGRRPRNVADRVGNAVQRAIAELADGFGMAEVGLSIAGVGRACISGLDPRNDGEPFVNQLVLGLDRRRGRPGADGWLTMGGIGDAGVLQRDSVEIDELRFPVRIETQRVVPDTGGRAGAAARPRPSWSSSRSGRSSS